MLLGLTESIDTVLSPRCKILLIDKWEVKQRRMKFSHDLVIMAFLVNLKVVRLKGLNER